MTTPLLAVDGLTVRFRTEDGPVLAVDEASFDVRAGEVVALVGESGCGKSVTAMALTRLLPRTATITGSVRLEGESLSEMSAITHLYAGVPVTELRSR